MNKKLNIIEAMKMPIGNIFEVKFLDDYVFEDNNRLRLEKCADGSKLVWENGEDAMCGKHFILATFIPIQQPVRFMEVIEAYSKGKTIKSIEEIDGKIFTHIYVPDGIADCIEDDSRCAMTAREILNGNWYIEESEELEDERLSEQH